MMKLKKKEWGLLAAVLVVALFVIGWRFDVPRGLGLGDILYADRSDRMTRLALGSSNQRLGGGTAAPAYVDQNVLGSGAIPITTSADITLNNDQRSRFFHKITSVSGAIVPTVIAPDSAGYIYLIWNSSGQTFTIKKPGGTGGTIASTKTGFAMHDGTDYVVRPID